MDDVVFAVAEGVDAADGVDGGGEEEEGGGGEEDGLEHRVCLAGLRWEVSVKCNDCNGGTTVMKLNRN